MPTFATYGDLAGTAPGQVPWLPADILTSIEADAPRLLARASEVIAEAVTTGYSVDLDGNPYDTTVADALRNATCAQVEQWMEVGEENDIAGYHRSTAVSTQGLSLAGLPASLAPRARRILRAAGLMWARTY